MKHGDFTQLAKSYINRPAYAPEALKAMIDLVGATQDGFVFADVGAGTGKWTRMLADFGLTGVAVEPNDAMREEGIVYTQGLPVQWRKGSGEEPGLEAGAYGWITMASSFHWTDPDKSLPAFYQALKSGGYLTVLWNPRDLGRSELHTSIEQMIHDMVPGIQRKSSGASHYTEGLEACLVDSGLFADVVLMEHEHVEQMSVERYMGAWRSVNDIQVQAGPERFQQVLDAIQERVAGMSVVPVPYKTRAWTARRCDR